MHHGFSLWMGISTVFTKAYEQSPCTTLTAGKCLLLGLCKETVKQSNGIKYSLGEVTAILPGSLLTWYSLGKHTEPFPRELCVGLCEEHGREGWWSVVSGWRWMGMGDISHYLLSTALFRMSFYEEYWHFANRKQWKYNGSFGALFLWCFILNVNEKFVLCI